MKFFVTSFKAIDPKDQSLKTWAGPNIRARSFEEAQEFCESNYGHLVVDGELA